MTEFYNSDSKLETQKSYINGSYLANSSSKTFSSIHPGNKEVICEIEEAGQIEVDAAVLAAREGFKIWSTTSATERAKVLNRAAEILRSRNEELAQLETLDTGKPISETRVVDISTGVDVMEFYAGVAQSIGGDYLDFPGEGYAIMKREPLGVCLGIGAWNYPIQIAMWKSSPALACGNSMIFKPSEYTPLTALKLAEIYTEAGLPDGVFNVVQGARETGSLLVDHHGIDKISLTGSVDTGKAVMAQGAKSLKKVTLELGGKSPIIVFDDADIDSAVNAIVPANFYSTGQVCSNGTRIFVQRGIYAEVIEKLIEESKKIVVGDPFNDNTTMGPLLSQMQFDKVTQFMDAAKNSSARNVLDSEQFNVDELQHGYFVPMMIMADSEDDMSFVREEVFGPLMSILPFDTEEEALNRANSTEFGLAGAVFSKDFARANRVANELEAGSVWINTYHILPPSVPFGGYKNSGIGRENGLAAIEHYTQVKMIYASLQEVESSY